jgi:signal transduction histidine kinase
VTQNRFIILYCLLLIEVASFAQNLPLIDSIRTSLTVAEGKERFDLLNDLAWEYRFAYPDSTIEYSRQAYEFGKSIKLSKGLARSLNIIGIGQNYKGQRLAAFEQYARAHELAIQQGDSIQIAHTNNNIGRLFYEQGLLSRSYEYFVKARSIFTSINDSTGLGYTYQSLGNLYKSQRDYAKAEDNYLKAYYIRLDQGNPRDIMSAQVYLGRSYQESNQIKKSIQFFELADSTGHVINDEINLAEIKTYLAESYLLNGDLNKAESMCNEGLAVIVRKNNIRMMPQGYHTMGQILLKKNDLVGARKYFGMSLDIAERIKDLTAKMDAYFYLWKVSEKLNNRADVLTNHNQYLVLKDSIKDLDLTRQVERLEFEIEIQRKEQENELLKANQARNSAVIQQQKLQNVILIVIVGFVSILGLLQWINGKKRREINEKLQLQGEEIKRQNEKLSKHNQQLSDLNHEKDTLMSIVAHDLKSPLNRIDGISYLMGMDGKLDRQLQEYVDMVKQATRNGLDLITDLLDVHMLEENVEPNYSTFDISRFLLDKTEALSPAAETKNIHLNIVRVENEEIFTDRDYLDRIFDNLLNNAIKFSPRNSMIEIAADRTEYEFWISVKDHGPGFSEHDKNFLFQKFKKLSARPTGGETSNGLGLAIVKILVDRLKGKIELISQQGKGSHFIVRFPQQKQYA